MDPRPPNLPRAYFLTWRTYATWLHGDQRGSIDLDHNTPTTPPLPPSPNRESHMRSVVSAPPMLFNGEMRQVVETAIRDHANIRQWQLHALAVRTNHVHVVVGTPNRTAETVMEEFKSWGTRRLRRAELVGPATRVWADHGSTRYLWDPEHIAKAVDYVVNWQDAPTMR
jgi:REP element-mobilizing transposase RayT